MTRPPKFIHLRVHSEYSLLEGAIALKKLPALCVDMQMPAVAVTDTNNMYCALEFSEVAFKVGIQPIIGCQIDLEYDPVQNPIQRPCAPAPIVLLAQSKQGYDNLMKLNSRLYLKTDGRLPQITLSELQEYSSDLICLTGGPEGPLGKFFQDGQTAKAEALTDSLQEIFADRLYIELQRHPDEGGQAEKERQSEPSLIALAYARNIPLVATNDCYFKKSDLYESHDALLCVAQGAYVDQQEPRRRLTPQHYLKTPREMETLFADLPEALENTIEIAQRCSFRVAKHDPILPKFADDETEALRAQARDGLRARLKVIEPAASVEEYEKRLEFELQVIEDMGFPGYFLIVADFIAWSKAQNIPVGPGRGSGAGSLVAYALTITDLDPLRYGLLFERFLNPDRVSMPDFDIDFCMDRREEVIKYVQEKYGADRVGQIITFGALLSKAAIRDIGRVLQMPYGQVDRLSKLIPVEGVKPVSVEKALAEEPRLREEADREEVVARLLNYAQQVEGLLRNASTHAAGIVIGDRPLDELVPLYRDPKSEMPATQFNLKWVEEAGLVKFDFLGLKTLTVIQNSIDLILASDRPLHIAADGREIYTPAAGAENQINAIPLDDKGSYDLYASAKTVAVFQVESSGMMDALKRMKPNCIEDIVALVALYRPGPMENIPKYCEVKNGLSKRELLHPTIDHLLDETQGIIVYQEQVMEIARQMAGYTLGGADLLRRAMGKKIQEAMDAEKPKFLEGAAKNGVDSKTATATWDLLDKFANYGFNKSHAAAYAVVSYQTAWLKANHPVEFMAGVMNCDIHLTDKLSVYFQEVRMGLELPYIPPCVNRSDARFTVKDGALLYALGALKNTGVEAMKMISAARDGGEFSTVFDFARRVDLKRIGKRPLEMLARAGAFDMLDRNRRRIFENLDALSAYSQAIHEQRASNQTSLFGEAGADMPEPRLLPVDDWPVSERLAQEHIAIGFYLSGHPLDDYAAPLRSSKVHTFAQITQKVKDGPLVGKIAGIVAGIQERKSAKGNRYAFIQLSDSTGGYEVTMFSETLENARAHLEVGAKLVLQVEVTQEADQAKFLTRAVQPMDDVILKAGAAGLRIYIDDMAAIPPIATVFQDVDKTTANTAKGPVEFCLMGSDLPGEIDIALGAKFPTTPQIKGALNSLPGVVMVEEM